MNKKSIFRSIGVCFLCLCILLGTSSLRMTVNAEADRESLINHLMEQRATAISVNDSETIDEIDAELMNLGVEDLSSEEVMEIFAEDENKARWIVPPTSANVDWKSYQSTIASNGTFYATQTLLAQPKNSSSNLFMEGSKTISSTYRWKTGAMNLIKVVASASVSSITKKTWAVTVYDSLKSFISGISPETEVKGMGVDYRYTTIETVSMIYVKKQAQSGDQNLKLSHISSTCTSQILSQYSSLSFTGGTAALTGIQKNESIVNTPDGYNNASRAVESYRASKETKAFVTYIDIIGIESKPIATVYPLAPEGPTHIM